MIKTLYLLVGVAVLDSVAAFAADSTIAIDRKTSQQALDVMRASFKENGQADRKSVV